MFFEILGYFAPIFFLKSLENLVIGGREEKTVDTRDMNEKTTTTIPMTFPPFIWDICSKKTTIPETRVELMRIIIEALRSIMLSMLTISLFWFLKKVDNDFRGSFFVQNSS